jgi:hypothetical protein
MLIFAGVHASRKQTGFDAQLESRRCSRSGGAGIGKQMENFATDYVRIRTPA